MSEDDINMRIDDIIASTVHYSFSREHYKKRIQNLIDDIALSKVNPIGTEKDKKRLEELRYEVGGHGQPVFTKKDIIFLLGIIDHLSNLLHDRNEETGYTDGYNAAIDYIQRNLDRIINPILLETIIKHMKENIT